MPPPINRPDWSLSVVSHGHMPSVRRLLRDFRAHLDPERFEVLLTLNIDEPAEGLDRLWPGAITRIANRRRKGFGANHNAAFRRARGRFFAAIDPDLRLHGDPFGSLKDALEDPRAGIASTVVLDESGDAADNARDLPTPARILRRRLRREQRLYQRELSRQVAVDWVAGLFMAMRAETFETLGGFDERYFLYCEDAELCIRAWNRGFDVRVVPAAPVTHPARRQTTKNWRHFQWHVASLAKLWTSDSYRQFAAGPRQRRLGPIEPAE